MSDVLARASIAVAADTSAFDKAMDALPAKAQEKIAKSVAAIKAEMAEVGKGIATAGNLADVKKLTDYYDKLKQSLDSVKMSAIAQASALNPAAQAMKDAGASTRDWGRATLEASRGIEDLQFGVGFG